MVDGTGPALPPYEHRRPEIENIPLTLAWLGTLPQEDKVGAVRAVLQNLLSTTACLTCGKPITRFGHEGPWRHMDAAYSRGCRAASFHVGEGADDWDDTLDRSAKAAPRPGAAIRPVGLEPLYRDAID